MIVLGVFAVHVYWHENGCGIKYLVFRGELNELLPSSGKDAVITLEFSILQNSPSSANI